MVLSRCSLRELEQLQPHVDDTMIIVTELLLLVLKDWLSIIFKDIAVQFHVLFH